MAKEARIGEMRTRIVIQRRMYGRDAEGSRLEEWESLFDGQAVWCKWVNPHGTELYELMRLSLREPATITMRYSPLINARCRVFMGHAPTGDPETDDPHAYEILSIDNVQDERKLLEIKVQRMVKA